MNLRSSKEKPIEKLLLLWLIVRPTLDVWRDVAVFSYQNTVINLNAVFSLLIILWSIAMLIRHRRSLPRSPYTILAGLLLALATFSAGWSVQPATTVSEALKLFTALSLFILAYSFAKQRIIEAKTLAGAIVLSAVIPIIVGLYQALAGTGLATFDIHGRIYGTLAHPNVFAFLLLSLIILALQFEVVGKKIMLPFLGVLILLTYTRAAFVGLAIFLSIVGFVQNKKLFKRIVLGFSLALALLVGTAQLLPLETAALLAHTPIISRLTTANEDADSLAWRQALIQETMPIIRAHPWLGYGFGTFEKVWTDNRSAAHFWDDSAEAHNDYLRLALELGLAGLALYIAFLATLIAKSFSLARQDPKQHLHLFAWIITFAVVSLSDNLLHHTPVLWLTFAYWGSVFGGGHQT